MSDPPPVPAAISLPELFREHERWLRTLAQARLQDADLVDEILQNVALAVVQAEQRAVAVREVAPWLYRVLVRHCLLCRRQLGRRRRLQSQIEIRHAGQAVDGQAADPLGWLIAHERQSLLQRAMSELPERDRELLSLKYLEGWSYRQMADSLGVSFVTIESRLHRARRRLRERLEAHLHDEEFL